MSLRVRFTYKDKNFLQVFQAPQDDLEGAAQKAIERAGAIVKAEARANIAASGLGQGFVQAMRVDIYPKRGTSMGASAHIYHKIFYAGVFEEGAAIRGKPRMWLPIGDVPKRIGGKRMSPGEYEKQIGPLQYVSRGGKPPLLVARMRATKTGRKGKVTVAKLRAGSQPSAGRFLSVPVFVGIDTVKEKKKLNITAIVQRASDQLPALFNSFFKSG